MFLDRLFIVCALTLLSSSAFAADWEEVFTDGKNSTNAKFYFDRNVVASRNGAVETQYMIVEPQPRPVSKSKPEGPSYDKAIYRAVIDCKNYAWKFLHRAYYLNGAVTLEEDTHGGTPSPPPTGTAPYKISEKACAMKK
jgi:hypothetical protein